MKESGSEGMRESVLMTGSEGMREPVLMTVLVAL